jgi:menaquinone-dependent protoporphyrinogen IX oxidase
MIVFESRYGSTREYAAELANALGVRFYEASSVPKAELDTAPFLIVGSPIYGPSILPAMEAFLRDKQPLLVGRPLAAFVVCGDHLWLPEGGEGAGRNLAKLTGFLVREPFATAVFGGRLRMDELNSRDEPDIRAFYRRIGREALGFDRMNLSAVAPFARDILERLATMSVAGGKP